MQHANELPSRKALCFLARMSCLQKVSPVLPASQQAGRSGVWSASSTPKRKNRSYRGAYLQVARSGRSDLALQDCVLLEKILRAAPEEPNRRSPLVRPERPRGRPDLAGRSARARNCVSPGPSRRVAGGPKGSIRKTPRHDDLQVETTNKRGRAGPPRQPVVGERD